MYLPRNFSKKYGYIEKISVRKIVQSSSISWSYIYFHRQYGVATC